MFPKNPHLNEQGMWVYYPPKWYDFRFRGGYFVFCTMQLYRDNHKTGLTMGLEFAQTLIKDEAGTWYSEVYVQERSYGTDVRHDVHVIAIKKKEDAVQFRLMI